MQPMLDKASDNISIDLIVKNGDDSLIESYFRIISIGRVLTGSSLSNNYQLNLSHDNAVSAGSKTNLSLNSFRSISPNSQVWLYTIEAQLIEFGRCILKTE